VSDDFGAMTLNDFLDQTAAKTPTPGGGAVASVTAALAAALARMVLNFSRGKKSLVQHSDLHVEALNELERLLQRSMELARADAIAYGRLNELWKLPEDDERRQREFPAAVEAAIEAPHALLHAAMEMLRLLARLPEATNRMLASDLTIAAILAEAAARAAAWNVRINLPLLGDDDLREQFAATLQTTLKNATELVQRIEQACGLPT